MTQHATALPVTLAASGLCPRAFRWFGRMVRVLAVEGISTYGAGRRYRVRTAQGVFELELRTDVGIWRMHRGPTWLERARARWRNAPRYPLPVQRRRAGRVAAPLWMARATNILGGSRADWLAVVR
jgi:hypothetical protein